MMNKIIPISKKARKKLRLARYPALSGGAIDSCFKLFPDGKIFVMPSGGQKLVVLLLLLLVEINCIFSSRKESNFSLWRNRIVITFTLSAYLDRKIGDKFLFLSFLFLYLCMLSSVADAG
jgi:hypothetical protein